MTTGLLDITHASDYITVSWNSKHFPSLPLTAANPLTEFHDHWKGSLIGHSDNNAGEDTGKLHVTYHHNSFINVNSRLPSIRFGTVHIYNDYHKTNPASGVNSRMGAQVRVENSVFENTQLALVTNLDSDADGSICDVNNILSGSSTKRITKTCNLKVPYSYSAEPASSVANSVNNGAGVGKVAP
jgi:pectate lyase